MTIESALGWSEDVSGQLPLQIRRRWQVCRTAVPFVRYTGRPLMALEALSLHCAENGAETEFNAWNAEQTGSWPYAHLKIQSEITFWFRVLRVMIRFFISRIQGEQRRNQYPKNRVHSHLRFWSGAIRKKKTHIAISNVLSSVWGTRQELFRCWRHSDRPWPTDPAVKRVDWERGDRPQNTIISVEAGLTVSCKYQIRVTGLS